ncbi:hypothetical protein PFTANZ_04362 [Plasmodium falciparum Tanzania (2000708)]|uniref:Uncharacterized protein n=1 Tax=Plasmodium falciparum Tanzania (2000708) TaxID=1036725 RepID=A0A024W200_PLAFA|nr:hypothetical protein PFTANZ_04362 [Plasmodium falciparum Tanzania (2000708)]
MFSINKKSIIIIIKIIICVIYTSQEYLFNLYVFYNSYSITLILSNVKNIIYYKIFKRNKFHLSLMRKISLILIKKSFNN